MLFNSDDTMLMEFGPRRIGPKVFVLATNPLDQRKSVKMKMSYETLDMGNVERTFVPSSNASRTFSLKSSVLSV